MASSDLHIAEAVIQGEWGSQTAIAFEEAAAALDLERWIVERFRHPAEESTAYLQLIRDSGDAACIPLLQVQHSAICGPTAGSLAIAPELRIRDCEAMAMERSWQAALLGLPLGGAAYGLVCDPGELSERELMRLLGFAGRQLCKSRGGGWLLSPGAGCNRELFAKLFAETRVSRDFFVTGKPDCLGGLNLDQFAAEGVAAIVSAALLKLGKPQTGAKVAIQGFGSLGQAISQRLAGDGLSIVALSDNSGGIYRSDGLILDDVRARFAAGHVLFGYGEAERINRAELLRVDADVLVVTCGPNEMDARNWNTVPAPIVVEADWDALSSPAQEQMAREVVFVPWMLAASGALLGSYFESRNLQVPSGAGELLKQTRRLLDETFGRIDAYTVANECSFQQAIYRLSIERAAAYARACGVEC